MKQEFVAIDIALIPDQRTLEEAIRLSRKYCDYDELPLSLTGTYPHISLMMLIVKVEDLAAICKRIVERKNPGIAKNLELTIDSCSPMKNSRGDLLSSWNIEHHVKLLQLHENLLNIYREFHHEDLDDSMIYNSMQVGESGMKYIRNFYHKHSKELYDPHITLGYGAVKSSSTMLFKPERLGVYELGKHCSCFKAFWETNI